MFETFLEIVTFGVYVCFTLKYSLLVFLSINHDMIVISNHNLTLHMSFHATNGSSILKLNLKKLVTIVLIKMTSNISP